MSRSAASPRVLQLYSPRRPSPLGLPPHTIIQNTAPCSAFPKTPERYYIQQQSQSAYHMRFPPEARRPVADGETQRSRAPPPAPLRLDTQHHPAAVPLPLFSTFNGQTLQPYGTQEMMMMRGQQPSPTPSSISSLSVYSSDSVKKNTPVEMIQEDEEEDRQNKGGGGGCCICFSAFFSVIDIYFNLNNNKKDFSTLFGTKSKSNKMVPALREHVIAAEPAPAPQMVQTRRRPRSLILVR